MSDAQKRMDELLREYFRQAPQREVQKQADNK